MSLTRLFDVDDDANAATISSLLKVHAMSIINNIY